MNLTITNCLYWFNCFGAFRKTFQCIETVSSQNRKFAQSKEKLLRTVKLYQQGETGLYREIVSARTKLVSTEKLYQLGRNCSVQRNCITKEKLFQKRVTAPLQRNCFSDRENVFQLKETFSAHTKKLSQKEQFQHWETAVLIQRKVK